MFDIEDTVNQIAPDTLLKECLLDEALFLKKQKQFPEKNELDTHQVKKNSNRDMERDRTLGKSTH